VTPEAEERLTKAERFLSQAMGLSAEAAPEAVIHRTYYAMLHAAAAVVVEHLAERPRLMAGSLASSRNWSERMAKPPDRSAGRSIARRISG